METGLQIGAIVVLVSGIVLIVIYQRWKKTSRTQADLDARRDEAEARLDEHCRHRAADAVRIGRSQ